MMKKNCDKSIESIDFITLVSILHIGIDTIDTQIDG